MTAIVAPVRAAGHRLAGLAAFSHFGVDLVGGGFAALLPAIADRHRLSVTAVGALVAAFSVTALALQPLLGALADRRASPSTTAMAASLAAILLAATLAAPDVFTLFVAVILGGLAAGLYHPAGATLLRQASADPSAGSRLALAWFSAAGTAGLALGPLAGLLVAGSLGGAMAPVLALPALVASTLLWRARPVATTNAADVLGVVGRPGSSPQRGALVRILVAATLTAIATTSLVNSVPLWIASQPDGSLTDPAIGLALAAFSSAVALGAIATGIVLERRPGAVRHLPAALLAAALAIGFVLRTDPGSAEFVAALAVTGVLIGPAGPILLGAAQDAYPHAPGTSAGLVMGLSYGVAGAVFVLVAQLHQRFGFPIGIAAGALTLLPAGAIVARDLRAAEIGAEGRGTRGLFVCGCASGAVAPSGPGGWPLRVRFPLRPWRTARHS